MKSSFLVHPIPPLYDEASRVLILGSFPSPKSREAQFFYGHPQNRFWKVMARVLDWRGKKDSTPEGGTTEGSISKANISKSSISKANISKASISKASVSKGNIPTADGPVFVPSSTEEKRAMLLSNHIALWDTIASCEITGASDSSITNVTPNDLSPILEAAKIRAVFCNGAASHKLYMKYLFPVTGREALKLPSTSPANAAWSVDRLTEAWCVVRKYL